MKNLEERQKQITEQFEQTKKAIEELQRALNEKQVELLRLQGGYQVLKSLELEQKELENKKDKKI